MRSLKLLVPALMLLVAGTTRTNAQIISSDRVIDWTHMGVRGGIPARTNLLDVTQSPYNADNTGATDATAAIQNAINAANSNDVVYLPDGYYSISSLSILKSYVTLRGHTNSVLMGGATTLDMLRIGPDMVNYNYYSSDHITNGATKGSTQIQTLENPPLYISVGEQLVISDAIPNTPSFPVMGVKGVAPGVAQELCVTAISGNTVTLSAPLIWNFTNAPIIIGMGNNSIHGVGVENLIITATNQISGGLGSYSYQVIMAMSVDSWVSNCAVLYSHNYAWYFLNCSHSTLLHNTIRYSQGSGSDHSGFRLEVAGENLIADNIIADGLQPAIEFNGGFCGNVIFANYLTNNVIGIDDHGPHPMMNLWEANKLEGSYGGYFEMDGYFGSGSHQTLLRNVFGDPYTAIEFKRWTTYMTVVGNILGTAAGSYSGYQLESSGAGSMILNLGYPNIGNNTYNNATSSAPAWNFPLSSSPSSDGSGQVYPSSIFTFTNSQGPTTNLLGDFSSVSPKIVSQSGSIYCLLFQDAVNTNLYYPTNGVIIVPTITGTTSNIWLNVPVTVSAGMKVYIGGQNTYQQFQFNDKFTDKITGNYDYYNNATTWDTNGVQTIPTSLVYPDGAPGWWGTNRWPAIDPMSSPIVTAIPAQLRYSGVQSQAPSGGGLIAPPKLLKAFGHAN